MNDNEEKDYASAAEVHAKIMREGDTCFNLVVYGLSVLIAGLIALGIIVLLR